MEVNNPNECLPGLSGQESVDVDISEETEEVDGETSTPSGLLSLKGKAEELLLSHVARGEGGLQRLLTLRLTCSTTKGWVDDPSLLHGRQLFSNCQARVDLSEDGSLDKFLANPPPSHVTSLLLLGADSNFDPKRDSWNQFVQFWSPRLNSLEITELFLPPNIRLSELVASTSLRRLHCDHISCFGPADVPDFLLQLEELRLDDDRFIFHGMEDPQRRAILQILGSPQRLVIPEWRLSEAWRMNFATEVLRVRKQDVGSQLTFQFERRRFVDESEMDKEELHNFVTAVAASPFASTIRIQNVSEGLLREIVALVEEEAALKFFRCVESIHSFSGNFDHIFQVTNFSNLKRLWCVRRDLLGLRAQTVLPPFLPSLELHNLKCSAAELVKSLKFLSETCPNLQTLKLRWICATQQRGKKNEQFGYPQEERVFPNLRSLTLAMENGRTLQDGFVDNARLVLSEGLDLPRLSLTTFFVVFGNWDDSSPAPLVTTTLHHKYSRVNDLDLQNCVQFDAELLSSLIEGPIGVTLCNLDIEERWLAEGAKELLEGLKGKANENWENWSQRGAL